MVGAAAPALGKYLTFGNGTGFAEHHRLNANSQFHVNPLPDMRRDPL